MTPPNLNPIGWRAQKRAHWANPVHIKDNFWTVEEGSGPRATIRRLSVVSETKHGWSYRGHVDLNREWSTMELWGLDGRTWKIYAPTAELVLQIVDLVKEHG